LTPERGEPQNEQVVSFFAMCYLGLRKSTSSTIP
jgi:hypothetical protein